MVRYKTFLTFLLKLLLIACHCIQLNANFDLYLTEYIIRYKLGMLWPRVFVVDYRYRYQESVSKK